ncbi:MAG: ERAP1-like C-terminal domain-containing protein, partial [Propionibacteriaceae bacterium]|nr:ERAP1-like C-terminal domain-containing protein [Propionibacteriaceae bacterium]
EGAPPRSAQVRRTPGGEPARRAHTLTIATLADDGTELGRARLEISAASEVVLPAGFVLPDVADETWARVRPSRPVADWPPVSAVADPLARVVLWNSIRDQMRSAELDPKVALETVRAELPDEGEDLIARAILDWAQTVAAGPFTRPDQRQERLCWIADTASDILAKSQPGTDLQLSMWRALMGCTDDADALAGWLAGEGLPDGRVLDADLRWAVTTRLVSLNGDRGLIEQAYATDRSTAGRVHRARALAALPDPEAKAAAFTALMSPGELSAYELYATAEGFFLPHQGEVTDVFVEKFFRHINHTANFRSGWALGQVVSRAFPVTANNRRTLELAQDLLASVDLAPGVRRPLAEATDILRRAVTSVEKYAPLD